MANVLYITNHDPWGIGGGSYASAMFLRSFRKLFRNDNIDLCIADNCKIPTNNAESINIILVKKRNLFSQGMSIITGELNRFRKIGIRLLRSKHYDYVILDHSSLGILIKYIPQNTKCIVIHHNFEPDFYRDNHKSGLIRSIFLPYVRHWEKQAYERSDLNLFLTKEDLIQFQNTYGINNKLNFVTGLIEDNTGHIVPLEKISLNPIRIVMTGALDNVQNIDGIKYFQQELYPLIPKDIEVIIAGKNPSKELLSSLSDLPNVKIIPNPKNMDEILRLGSIYLCPTRLGSGIKVRISDGLKVGLPVIAHEISCRGYEEFIKKGLICSFSTTSEFKRELNFVIMNLKNQTYIPIEIARLYADYSSENKFISYIKSFLGLKL